MRASEYIGFDMYSDRGVYIGEVEEVILDIDDGEIFGLGIDEEDGKWAVVPYDRVRAIGDVIILRTGEGEEEMETEEVEEGEKPASLESESGDIERMEESGGSSGGI